MKQTKEINDYGPFYSLAEKRPALTLTSDQESDKTLPLLPAISSCEHHSDTFSLSVSKALRRNFSLAAQ